MISRPVALRRVARRCNDFDEIIVTHGTLLHRIEVLQNIAILSITDRLLGSEWGTDKIILKKQQTALLEQYCKAEVVIKHFGILGQDKAVGHYVP